MIMERKLTDLSIGLMIVRIMLKMNYANCMLRRLTQTDSNHAIFSSKRAINTQN